MEAEWEADGCEVGGPSAVGADVVGADACPWAQR